MPSSEQVWPHTPLATRNSLLAENERPLTVEVLFSSEQVWHRVPLATRYSLLAEHAVLALNIIDPACGSGHFLIAAAHRLAKRLAQVRTGDEEPAPEAARRALRDVIGRCLYGVDLNPMSAELCKVALWLEAHVPGEPLTFLDHRIRVGNSLVGAFPVAEGAHGRPRDLPAGVPDDAFKPLEGDDRAVASRVKKLNRDGARGQTELVISGGSMQLQQALRPLNWSAYSGRMQKLGEMPDGSVAEVRAKEEELAQLKAMPEYAARRLALDLWTAAFFWPLTSGTAWAPTTGAYRDWVERGVPPPGEAREQIERLARANQFFHWSLEFPEVFSRGAGGGFDVVLGNPPWEQIQFEPEEFFALRAPEIARAPNMAARKRLIAKLPETNPALAEAYNAAISRLFALQKFIHTSGRFPLTSFGRLNTAPLFCELYRLLQNPFGRSGIIVPTGIATDSFCQYFFADLAGKRSIASLFDFENGLRTAQDTGDEGGSPPPRRSRLSSGEERLLFPAVDSRFKFCLLTMSAGSVSEAQFAFFCHRTSDLLAPGKVFTLTPEEIALLNPNTRTCPVFRSRRDAEITKAIYRRVPVLIRDEDPDGNPWGIRFQLMFMMNTDSHLFRTREHLEAAGGALTGNRWEVPHSVTVDGLEVQAGRWLPLYEAKMVHHFDHRWATYEQVKLAKGKKVAGDIDTRDVTLAEKQDPAFAVQPRYWVKEQDVENELVGRSARRWYTVYRRITNTTNVRTLVAGCLPRGGATDGAPLLLERMPAQLSGCLLGNLSSFVCDYLARQRVGGVHLDFHHLKQMPVLPPHAYPDDHRILIVPRVLELVYTAWDMESFANDLSYSGEPFEWDDARRSVLRAELDATFFHLYGLERADVEYIMDTFPIIKRKDLAAHGSYRTKEAILEIYDAMAEAIRTGVPYKSRLDPPPANGWLPPPLEAAGEPGAPEAARRSPGATDIPPTGPDQPTTPPAASPSRQTSLSMEQNTPTPGDWVSVDGHSGLLTAVRSEHGTTTFTVLLEHEDIEQEFVSPPANPCRAE